jgi:hypothetical protein
MRRLSIILIAALIVPLTSCAARQATATPAPAPATATPAPATATPAPAPATSPAGPKVATSAKITKPPTTAALFGTQYAYLKSADLPSRRITFDLIEWYEGRAAEKACKADGEKPAENDWCVGWYIRNNNTRLRTLTVYPDAPLRLGPDDARKSVDLKAFVAGATGRVIRFDVDANRIMKADEVYTP